ncbi:MAG: class I SAM-dependent methyltransferase [Bdellovibrionales bacterium]|nr:class I SAM-dependent methyltransferase [Bdellovibrionales bacterium]
MGPVDCPLCGKKSPAPVLVSYKDLIWRKCAQCTFGFLFPYTSEEEQARNKSVSDADQNPEATYANYLKSAHLFSAVAEEKALWIQTHLKKISGPSVVIEIGPGLGGVLKKLRIKLPNQALLAVESQTRFADHLQGEGFPVLRDIKLLEDHPLSQKKNVVVFMDNVLEHIPHPLLFLKELNTIIGQKNRTLSLLVEVPNEFGIAFKAKIQDVLRGFPKPPTFPGHINLFTEKTLKDCALGAGFQNPQISPEPIRNISQIQYLSQSQKVSTLAKAVVQGLNVVPVDRLLGLSYWLRLMCDSKNPTGHS